MELKYLETNLYSECHALEIDKQKHISFVFFMVYLSNFLF